MESSAAPFKTLFLTLIIMIAGEMSSFSSGEAAGDRMIVFVSEGAEGTGSSWVDAMGNLQAAIDLPFGGYDGIDIWLSAGTYYPDTSGAADKRQVWISLRNGVRIFGGFNGTETQFEQRDPDTYISRLSGDFMQSVTNDDNSYHVVLANSLDSTSVTDGVYISDGYSANGTGNTNGCGLYMVESTAVFRNVTIENNHAGSRGGGIYMVRSNPTFEGVRILNCSSGAFGGAGYLEESAPVFKSCEIINNKSADYWPGGAFYLSQSNAVFINCILANNDAGSSDGGALYCGDSSPLILNCLLVNNYCRRDGGAIFCQYLTSRPRIVNSILWGNFNYNGMNHIWGGVSGEFNVDINHSVVQGGNIYNIPEESYTGNLEAYPRFTDALNETGYSTKALEADWRLTSSSPCLNSGISYPEMTGSDLDGNARVFGDSVDIGPYEFQGDAIDPSDTLVIFVKPGGAGSGTSWNDAIGELQKALDVPLATYLQKEIRISEGTYIPGTGNGFRAYWNTTILGGFDTTMVSRDERRPDSIQCILSGDIGEDEDYSNNCNNILTCYNVESVDLDGLVFEAAKGWWDILHEYMGGAVYAIFSQMNISNCLFRDNRTPVGGGALSLDRSVVNIGNCEFLRNRSDEGGAVNASGSYLDFNSCSFINGVGSSGGLDLRGSEVTLWNCLIANNYGDSYGAILASGGTCSLINSSLLYNSAQYDNVAGIYCGTDLSMINSILWGNISAGGVNNLEIKEGGTAFISHSDVQSGNLFGLDDEHYVNNISLYPAFVQAITVPGTVGGEYLADWSLTSNSPLIDRGTLEGLEGIITESDLSGNPRVFHDSIDIGPYEFIWNISGTGDEKTRAESAILETRVFPNPGSGPFTLVIPSTEGNIIIKLYDVHGRLIREDRVFENGNLEFEIDGPPGIYYLHVEYPAGTRSYAKIIKR
jgi:hypothetical protein